VRLLLDTAVVGEICHPRLWALQRKAGRVTAAVGGLDGDVLIAAQALAEDAVIVTPNTRHFDSMVRAVTWQEV